LKRDAADDRHLSPCRQQKPSLCAGFGSDRGCFAVSIRRGAVSEWFKEHAWNACIGVTLSRVRIPPAPPRSKRNFFRNDFRVLRFEGRILRHQGSPHVWKNVRRAISCQVVREPSSSSASRLAFRNTSQQDSFAFACPTAQDACRNRWPQVMLLPVLELRETRRDGLGDGERLSCQQYFRHAFPFTEVCGPIKFLQ
jgi:hypothetical protein